jgi:hypothetical protein
MQSGVKIKGSALGNTFKYLKEKHGIEVHDKVVQGIPEQVRKDIVAALPSSWYPVEYVGDLCASIRAVLGPSDPEINFKISRESAKATFNLVYKVFFKLGSPQYIIGKVAAVWSTLADKGSLTIHEKGDKYLVLRLLDFPYRNPEYCAQRLRGWFHAPLELSGCMITESRHTVCTSQGGPYCEWKIAWR